MLQERNPSDLYECPLCEEKVLEKDKSLHETFYCKVLFENAQGPVPDTNRKSSGERRKYYTFSELAKRMRGKCTYCETTLQYDMLLLHKHECEHRPIKCLVCSATLLLKDVQDHHCKPVKENYKGRAEKKNQKESKVLQERNLSDLYECPLCEEKVLEKDKPVHESFYCKVLLENAQGPVRSGEMQNQKDSKMLQEIKPPDLYECPLCKEKLLEKYKSIHESFYCEALFENANGAVFATLIQDLKKVLLDGQDHNLIFNVRDKEIKAHRDILRARSEVFRSMLNGDMVENTSGIVNVPDCDPEAFEQLLLYIYSGKVEKLDENNMFELYYAADKYSLVPLKQICGAFIKRSLSVTNVCEVIKLATKHSDEGLRIEAVDYFMNNTSDILPTVEWQTFLKENSTIGNELFIKAFNKVKVTQSS